VRARNNVAAAVWDGIRLWSSSNNNSIFGNNITGNNDNGISLGGSFNAISENNITKNYHGVRLCSSSNNISGNNIAANNAGIHIEYSYNVISGNNIAKNNWYGVALNWSASSNIVSGNNIANNYLGIWFWHSSNNRIYHNNFIDNTQQVAFYSSGYTNLWGEGYPSGGNFWSDYNPPDLYSGPYQNETGSDGIGDVSYVMDKNNIDRYPLIYPYGYVPTPDVNNDGIVDIEDLTICALAMWSYPGHPKWNPQADLNNDGIIDIIDSVMIPVHFRETL